MKPTLASATFQSTLLIRSCTSKCCNLQSPLSGSKVFAQVLSSQRLHLPTLQPKLISKKLPKITCYHLTKLCTCKMCGLPRLSWQCSTVSGMRWRTSKSKQRLAKTTYFKKQHIQISRWWNQKRKISLKGTNEFEDTTWTSLTSAITVSS